MEFSDEAVKFAGPVPPTSPDGRYVAVAVEYRLIVRDWQTLRVVQMYSCLDRIQHVEWSSDSSYILCGLYDRSIVQVWSILEPEWTCKIDEGLAGITSARWCPDGRSILVTAEFQIKATVWSLVDKACVQLAGPKFADAGLAFNPDGTQLAVAERNNCKDFLTILACSDWKTQVHFQLPTQDLADLCWSPSGDCLAVWDSLLTYRLLVYSSYGDQLANYTPYADALGIKTVHWSPCGQFIAVGSYDEAARILSHVTWRPLLTCSHTASVSEPSNVVAYREVASRDDKDTDNSTSKYVVCELPVSIPSKTPPLDKPDPKLGVGE
ncbi:unnamed protein product [Ostreobium quekettii]|uniref:Uncharacterized protein n=1 Tax=Ostreobium quekettii TaxID=121088 RepID=A0A8S1IR31_9CHLO|nr:unnamed protein product [Ostreobium quekettii]|eukprot:evm.model.scf_472.1 EVM.evm.TU.scf_472.1   scf_472:10513-13135(+)